MAAVCSPSSRIILVGQSASFTATASGSMSATSLCKWTNANGTVLKTDTGVTNRVSSYTKTNCQKYDNGYKLRATFYDDNGSDVSNWSYIYVRYTPTLNPAYPANVNTVEGSSATFEMKISSAGYPTSYTSQWYKKGIGDTDFVELSGETADSLVIASVTDDNNGDQYKCRVTNASGYVDSRIATLTIDVPIKAEVCMDGAFHAVKSIAQNVNGIWIPVKKIEMIDAGVRRKI